MGVQDLVAVGTLIVLEALLSADNALVLALIARRLPDKAAQSRALTVGVGLSFALRAVGLLLASLVIQLWYLRAAGALYLLYLSAAHFLGGGHRAETPPRPAGAAPQRQGAADFRRVVTALALTDAAFAVDSILVAVALTSKLWVIYLGVALGIVALRFVSGAFLKLLERFPSLDHIAYALVGWAGLRLLLEAIEAFGRAVLHQHWPVVLPEWAFWTGMGTIVLVGTASVVRRRRSPLTR